MGDKFNFLTGLMDTLEKSQNNIGAGYSSALENKQKTEDWRSQLMFKHILEDSKNLAERNQKKIDERTKAMTDMIPKIKVVELNPITGTQTERDTNPVEFQHVYDIMQENPTTNIGDIYKQLDSNIVGLKFSEPLPNSIKEMEYLKSHPEMLDYWNQKNKNMIPLTQEQIDKNPKLKELGYEVNQPIPISTFNQILKENATPLSESAIFKEAVAYESTHKLPSMGFGSAGNNARKLIMNKNAELFPKGDFASQSATYNADKKALDMATNNYTASSAYAQSALADMDKAIELNKDPNIPRIGIKFANKPYQWWKENMTTNPKELAGLNLIVFTIAREYSKVVNGASASIGMISDTAAEKADQLMSVAQQPEVFEQTINMMKYDMENNIKSWKDSMDILNEKIKSRQINLQQNNQQSMPKKKRYIYNSETGAFE